MCDSQERGSVWCLKLCKKRAKIHFAFCENCPKRLSFCWRQQRMMKDTSFLCFAFWSLAFSMYATVNADRKCERIIVNWHFCVGLKMFPWFPRIPCDPITMILFIPGVKTRPSGHRVLWSSWPTRFTRASTTACSTCPTSCTGVRYVATASPSPGRSATAGCPR